VEKCGNLFAEESMPRSALSACSACRGDYQNPDRTAWPEYEDDWDLAEVEEKVEEVSGGGDSGSGGGRNRSSALDSE
jgi:hypothetical protein